MLSLSFSFSSDLPIELMLSAILFPIKSPVASSVFQTTRLEVVFAASIPVFLAVSINFLPYLLPNFFAYDKKPYSRMYFLNLGSVEYLTFIMSNQ